jgi:class 3 adenylate cyclase
VADGVARVGGVSGRRAHTGSYSLFVSGDNSLADLTGLASLTTVTDGLGLYGLDALADVGPLVGLQSVGTLSLSDNVALTSLAGLTGLTTLDWLYVSEGAFIDLDLPALTQVGHARVNRNAQLVSVSGLAGLTTMDSLRLLENPALTDLAGLAGLVTVTERFEISDNDALVSLEQVAALTSVGDRLMVTYNSELPQVDAVAWGAEVAAAQRKIARNKGDGPPADPCPYANDGECDFLDDGSDGLCVPEADADDCCLNAACE